MEAMEESHNHISTRRTCHPSGNSPACGQRIPESQAVAAQPPPTSGKEAVLPYVLQDIQDRAKLGYRKYRTYLETNNGRDALVDAYQEAIDLVMYLKQLLLERGMNGG